MTFILVTRATDDASKTGAELASRGHEPLLAPVTHIVPTGHAAPAGPFTALVMTSAHAAPFLDHAIDRSLPVFAVSQRVAELCRNRGFVSVLAAGGDAISLSALIRRSLAPPARLLHVTSPHHKAEPGASLTAAGYEMTVWEAYEARAVPDMPEVAVAALESGRLGGAVHYSRRSAEIVLRLAKGAGLADSLTAFPHFCLSEDVAGPVRAAGLTVRVAARPDEAALLDLIDL